MSQGAQTVSQGAPWWRSAALPVALVSAVQLMAELCFIKLGRYQFGSLSFAMIGLAMLGVALAGPLTGALGGPRRASRLVSWSLSPSLLLAGCALFALPHRFFGGLLEVGLMLACGAACLVALCLSAIPVYAAIARHGERVHALYAASLAGATAGTGLGFALLSLWGDLGGYLGCMALAVPAAATLRGADDGKHRPVAGSALLAVVLAVPLLPALDAAAHPGALHTESNAFSRIDVYGRDDGGLRFATAGLNGGTSSAPPGAAGRPRVPLSELSYGLGPQRVLVVGSGAGRDVAAALRAGARQVTAVEINGMIPAYMAARLPAAHDPYRHPGVRLLVGEGREAAARLAQQGERFDLVYVPIATLFGSSGHVLTETYLMTGEALSLYRELLRPGGVVAIYSPGELRTKVTRALRGAAGPEAGLLGFHTRQRFAVLARPDGPFTEAEVHRLDGLNPAFERSDVVGDLRRARGGPALVDDNPFLYNKLWSARGVRSVFGWNVSFMHRGFATVALVLLVILALSAWRTRSVPRLSGNATLMAFVVMGAAYTLYQTVVIQRLGFLVGHPLLSSAVVLPCTLAGTALGSRLSPWTARHRLLTTAALLAWIAVFSTLSPDQLLRAGWPAPVRVMLATLLSFSPFVVMGSFFPVIFGRTAQQAPALVALCWLCNGVAAVLGSILVIYGAMFWGFRSMLVVGGLCYAVLGLWDAAVARGAGVRGANLGLLAYGYGGILLALVALQRHADALR